MENTKNYLLNTWINRLIWSFCITLVTSLSGYSQITRDPCSSITYYIPPIFAGNSGSAYDDTVLQLITEEQEDVNFRILNASQSLVASGVINASNPFRRDFPFVNNENVIEIYDVNTPTRKGGLIIEAEKKITAILENNSGTSRHLITAKGLMGIGTEFFAASLTRVSSSGGNERHFLSFMALEDNTQVTIYPPSGLQLVGPSGNTSAPFNVNISALQSYIVLTAQASPYTISGARVVSDKPITMMSGCRHVIMGTGPWKESGIDQLIPVENLGQEYVLVQTPAVANMQYGFVVATEDGTQIFEDTNPTPLATINAGQYYEVNKTGADGTPKRIFTSKPSYVVDVVSPMSGGEVGMALAAPLDQNSGSKSVAFQKTEDTNSIAIILPDSALSTCMLNGTRADTLATLKSDIPGKSNYEVLFIEDANIANGQNVITCSERVHLMHISGVGNLGGRGGYYSNFDPINIYCDYGDLPDSYSTLLLSDGPSHQLDNTEFDENAKTSTLMLGSRVDDDDLPFPGDLATGDDLNQVDDEGSITLGPIDPCPLGKTINIPVNVVNTSGGNATLAGWLDLNQDGAFSASEGKVVNVENGATSKTLTFTLSSCIIPPDIAGRFRISSDALTTTSFKGFVNGGEVEDYKFTVLPYTLSINNCPSPITETGGAGCSIAVPDVTSGITANNSCGGLVSLASVTQTPAAGTTLNGPLTRDIQIVATDDCGISASCTVALTVNCMNMSFDTVPSDANLGCNPNITPATPGDVTVVNSCGTPTITVAEDSSTVGCTVKITNTWTARDTCNTTITASQVLTYTNDSQAPVFTSVPADEDLGFNPTITPATPGDVTVTDNCGIESLTVSSASTINGDETTLVNTWTATDACGNEQVATQTLTYRESGTQPRFSTVPPDRTGCNLSITPATIGDVTVVNGCGNKTITLSTTESANGCVVTTRNTWTARDECSNTVNAEQVIISTNDTQKPVFTSVPADKDLGFNPTITPATPGDVTVTDNCGTPSLTVSSSSTKNGDKTTLVNTWTARDDCGNEQVATQTLTYRESGTQPRFTTVPPDRTGCNLSITPATIGDVTVVDGCGNKTITLSTTQSTNGCVVTTRNTWTARDECNNTVSAEQVIISTNDTQKPVFTSVPADKDLGFNPTITPATPGDVTVTDNCGTPSLTVSSSSTKNGEETTLVNTWTARDACGNEQVATQTLTYKENTTQLRFTTVPPDRTGCNLSITPAAIGDVTVVDGCGNKTITLSTTQRTNGCVVTTRNTWTARDECSNTVSAEQEIINTIDTQGPVFSSVPADVNLGCNPNYTPASEGDVQVTENCTLASLNVTTAGSTNGCTITLINTWTAIDACGNRATASQEVVYTRDTTAPVFVSVPVSANLGCNPVIIPATPNDVTVTDNCGSGEVTLTSSSSQNGCVVTLVNTWKAADPCGNSSSKSQTLTYTADATDPAMNCPQDQTIDLGSNCKLKLPSFIPGDLADTCTDRASLNASQFPPAGTWVDAPIDVNVRLSARDACDNQSECLFKISYVCALDLGDRVWNDCNNNGVMDAGETGLVNVVVNLLDENGNLQENVLTDMNGNYLFDEIPVATYIVEIARNNFHGGVLSDWYNSTGNTSGEEGKDNGLEEEIDLYTNPPANPQNAPGIRSAPVNLGASDILTVDFGFYKEGTIGDFVWEDLNYNGIQDPGEPGLGNVSIQLYNTDSGEVKRQTTDAFGNYAFTGLLCANYYLEFSPPVAEYMVSHQDRGEDETDSDMNNAAITINTSLSSGENDRSWDAGFFRYATLGGVVWIDLNKNQDPSDEMINSFGLNNHTLNISLVGGDTAQKNLMPSHMDRNNLQTLANTTTDNNGNYQFMNLLPGKYLVTLETHNLPDWLTDSSTHKEYANETTLTTLKELQSGQQLQVANFGFFTQTTAISLKSFTAMLYEEGVLLNWETGSEKDNLGFNVYRSVSENSERIPVNAELIPALNVSSGGRYEWMDEKVGEGTWYYWLEDRDYNGAQTLHGPLIVGVGGESGTTKEIGFLKKGGLYRINDEVLSKSGLNDYDRISVKIDGVEVPVYVIKNRLILFYVPKDSEEMEVSLEDFPLRMDRENVE